MTKALTVAIVGGGFTGAAVAYHLACLRVPARIVVFEPRLFLGGGVAYDTADPAHRINVPAGKMSLLPGDDAHFARWVAERNAVEDDPQSLGPDGNLYPRRQVFGQYVAEHVAPFLSRGEIEHVRDSVLGIGEDSDGRWTIRTSAGYERAADVVVLATTHPPPAVPAVLEKALSSDSRLVRDASVSGALDAIGPNNRVLIVGTGLTMADVVASLDARGHTGRIIAVSRRGLLSRGHAPQPFEPYGEFGNQALTAVGLLRATRSTIDRARRNGLTWHAVLDALRAQAQTFWPNLSVAERRRIVRHLRPFWDVHRFRIAPQIESVLRERQANGSLEVIAGSLRAARVDLEEITVEIARRKIRTVESRKVDAVVVTTGPAHDRVIATGPHFASLAAAGLITPDAVGLGVACDRRGHALNRGGQPAETLFIAGPLARGTFGELMGLPQVSEYAFYIAEQVSHVIAGKSSTGKLRQHVEVRVSR